MKRVHLRHRLLPALFGFLSLSAALHSEDVNLRILCWEGYAPDAEVAKFEQAMTAKHGVPVKVTRS